MRTKCFSVLVLLLSLQFGYGQDTSNHVNFMNIPDEVIKKEIAFFSKKSKLLGYSERASNLKEVHPYICSDSLVSFNFKSTYINLFLKEMSEGGQIDSLISGLSWGACSKPTTRVGSLSVVTHSKFGVKIPLSSVSGLYEPHIFENTKKKLFSWWKKRPFSAFYKVFTSLDKRRTYIYMFGGQEGHKYEVTWVIRGSTYLYRVIDDLVSEN